jgi:hypothetical protein
LHVTRARESETSKCSARARERVIKINVQQEPWERESHASKCSTRARERVIKVNVQQEPERESYK